MKKQPNPSKLLIAEIKKCIRKGRPKDMTPKEWKEYKIWARGKIEKLKSDKWN